MLAELSWPQKNGWPVFKELSGNNTKNLNIKDDFSGKVLANYWQWDFRNSTPTAYQQKGELHLSGTVNARNPSGIAYTVRPQAINYEMRSFRYCLMTLVPFTWVWYFVERYQTRRGSEKLPLAVRLRERPPVA